jgi:hypothetical protein
VPLSNFFSSAQRFAGQALGQVQRAYQQADKAAGGWLPGGVASPASNVKRQIQNTASSITRQVAGTALNTLPDRVNLFGRYITGVGNTNLQLDQSTLADLRKATTGKYSQFHPTGEVFITPNSGYNPPGESSLPKTGAVFPYFPGVPKSVTNTLGRFWSTADPEKNTVRIQDRYDMVNAAEDPDLVSGKIQPQKAWNEIEAIWNPGAASRNFPQGRPLSSFFGDSTGYVAPTQERIQRSGESPTHSPSTRFARALMYTLPIKPEPYDVDITVPYSPNRERARPLQEEYDRLTPQIQSQMKSWSSGEPPEGLKNLSKRHSELEQQLRDLDAWNKK